MAVGALDEVHEDPALVRHANPARDQLFGQVAARIPLRGEHRVFRLSSHKFLLQFRVAIRILLPHRSICQHLFILMGQLLPPMERILRGTVRRGIQLYSPPRNAPSLTLLQRHPRGLQELLMYGKRGIFRRLYFPPTCQSKTPMLNFSDSGTIQGPRLKPKVQETPKSRESGSTVRSFRP